MTDNLTAAQEAQMLRILANAELHWGREKFGGYLNYLADERAPLSRDEAARREAVEETPADVPDNWVRRRVYKTLQEHSAYLNARFKDKTSGTFEYDGHRWRYEYTSFDDKGDYDVIVRPQSQPDAPPPPADDLVKRLRKRADEQERNNSYPADRALDRESAAAIEALRAERDAVLALIPTQFLDPPDGGEVKPVELVRRVVARVAALEGVIEATEVNAKLLGDAIYRDDPKSELVVRVGDIRRHMKAALAAGGENAQ